jgi:hypothetical protein
VAEAVAEFEGGDEALAGELALAEAQVGQAAEVETIRLSPSVLAVGVFGAVERVAGVLEGFAGVAGREVRFGEREAEVDGVAPEAAGVRQEDAGFGFGNCLGEISQMPVEFAGRVEAAELEFDVSGAAGEGAGVLKAPRGLGGIVRKEEPGEKGVAAAESGVIVVAGRELPVGLRLAECSGPVAAQELPLGLLDATEAEQRFAFQFGGALRVGCRSGGVSQCEVRYRSEGEGGFGFGITFRFRGERN